MTIIKDTFFGGAEKKAAQAQQKGIERGIEATEKATKEAREAAIPLFGQARQDLQQGFQGALDVFGQALPAQTQAFQQGNIGAQQQLLAGLPQFQSAILGGQVDFSQLQPVQVQAPNLGFFQQRLPGTAPAGVDPATTSPTIPNAFAPGTQFQGPVADDSGFFGNLLNPAPAAPNAFDQFVGAGGGFTGPLGMQQLQMGGFGMGVGPSLNALAQQRQLMQNQQPPQPTNAGQGDQLLRRPNFLTGGF